VVTAPRAVSWRRGRNFGAWHIRLAEGKTACGATIPQLRNAVAVVDLREMRGRTCQQCLAACRRALVEAL